MTTDTVITFDQLNLSAPILKALKDVGYETPSPIQTQTIPLLLEGKDVLGQAQTGTGKTAAFALPVLSNLDIKQKDPQVMVLAPTRELAIQVAEAFQTYASHIKGFHVLPVYGGQDYSGQIRALRRGVHVVVGTPGRVMDHMRKGTLKLDSLKTLVLDEADEMLRMGFIDDVEWILEQTPPKRQIALFSATMPKEVRRIATRHLNDPSQITIEMKTATASLIRQRYWPVSGMHKLDALTRILEAETFDAILIFVRTKVSTLELADKLSARGFAASALNGDIAQKTREMTVDKLKKGKLDILVATDVAARGLDVDRISHVINYDIPYDTEAYIHRIGRTGRAGRTGDAILFVTHREKRLLGAIEKATRKKIELMEMPSTELINNKRIEQFKQGITDTLASEDLGMFNNLIEQYQQEHDVPALNIASALAKLLQGNEPLLLQPKPARDKKEFRERDGRQGREGREARPGRNESRDSARPPRRERDENRPNKRSEPRHKNTPPEKDKERFRLEVGHRHEVMPGNIVGAISNEAGLDSKHIGLINIYEDYSTIDLPRDMPNEIFNDLKTVRVVGQPLKISRESPADSSGKPASEERKEKPKSRRIRPPISVQSQSEMPERKKKRKPKPKKKDNAASEIEKKLQ
ncbi:MAG: DEAD/DEAH box helicase [Gammaproteobacteria bacterium]|jgi:ATP-dependent RNA helicase DeaD|nr:DEAD/DEAH box helicase [Gammaproteobacteria bacterium]MBT6044082.1 DEAD/DEAH box helicase [Gammaproteobacteria bacterium]